VTLLVLLALAAFVVTIAVATSFGPALAVDHLVAEGLHGYALDHPGFVAVLQTWTDVFQPLTFRVIILVVAAWLLWRRRARAGSWVLVTMVLGGLAEAGLKALIGRDRPHWTDPVSHAVGESYPSGHSLTSAMAVAVLLLVAWPALSRRARWIWSAVAVAVPVITGFTRLALGVHFLTDVLGGWLIAAALVAAMALAPPRVVHSG
jgi:membrane-associated phospholipid phosphatase